MKVISILLLATCVLAQMPASKTEDPAPLVLQATIERAYSDKQVYNAGAIVKYKGTPYVMTFNNIMGYEPSIDSAFWVPIPATSSDPSKVIRGMARYKPDKTTSVTLPTSFRSDRSYTCESLQDLRKDQDAPNAEFRNVSGSKFTVSHVNKDTVYMCAGN